MSRLNRFLNHCHSIMFNYIARAWNVFCTGRPSGIEPPDQFGNCTQVHPGMELQDYMALRQRFSDEGFFRRERQSNVMSWVTGIMLAIMVALLQMIGERHALPALAKDVLSLVVVLFAVFSCVRFLHDHSVGTHRNDICRQLDRRLNIEVNDKGHKLPPALHRLFIVMTGILAVGVLAIIQVVETAPCSNPAFLSPKLNAERPLADQAPVSTAPTKTGVGDDSKKCGFIGAVASFWNGLCGGQGTILAAMIATFGVVMTIHTNLRTSRQSRINATITTDRLAWLRELRIMTADLNAAFCSLKLLAQQNANTLNSPAIDPIKAIELNSVFQKQASLIELFLDPSHPRGADAQIQELVRKVADHTLNGRFVQAELAIASLTEAVQTHTNFQWSEAVREAGQG